MMTTQRHNAAGSPTVSFVLATHNRRDITADTVARLSRCDLPDDQFEIIVVDNASTDGTADALADLADSVVRLDRNMGSCSKSFGLHEARGEFVVFVDDDSYPRPGSIQRMLDYFTADPDLGAAGFTVHLQDGRQEGAALPHVFVGCGVGFRAEALLQAGGVDDTFFMQAEEYDLAFRLTNCGWKVRMFNDLHVTHTKTPTARQNERTIYYDIRNNLLVTARYLPAPYETILRDDYLQRYGWMAEKHGFISEFKRGARAGLMLCHQARRAYRHQRLTPDNLEQFFCFEYVQNRMSQLAAGGVQRVGLAGLGKNIYAFYRGAIQAGLDIVSIGDDLFGRSGRVYRRGLAVVPLADMLSENPDAVVISNSGPVHAARAASALRAATGIPVHDWFGHDAPAFGSSTGADDRTNSAAADRSTVSAR